MGLDNGDTAVMAITNSKNPHILAFSWDGTEIKGRWICRDKATRQITHVEDLSMLHRAAMDMQLVETDGGSLKVQSAMKFDRDLYFTSTPNNDTLFSVVFHDARGFVAQLKEIFVDFGEGGPQKRCLARCARLDTRQEFVEEVAVDMGVLANFL